MCSTTAAHRGRVTAGGIRQAAGPRGEALPTMRVNRCSRRKTWRGSARRGMARLDFGKRCATFRASWTGNFRSALGLWEFPEPFAFSGNDAETIGQEFRGNDVVSLIGLRRPKVMQTHWASHEVSHLEARGIGCLGHHDELKGKRASFPRLIRPPAASRKSSHPSASRNAACHTGRSSNR